MTDATPKTLSPAVVTEADQAAAKNFTTHLARCGLYQYTPTDWSVPYCTCQPEERLAEAFARHRLASLASPERPVERGQFAELEAAARKHREWGRDWMPIRLTDLEATLFKIRSGERGMSDPRFLQDGFDKRLSHAIEEAGEFLAAAGKTQRWGLHSVNPLLPADEQETNEAWLLREMEDLIHALGRLGRAMLKTDDEEEPV